ncbi:MAG: 50S ribosomal protein L5 [Planctomycetes bacterium]|nr:50S ribosomal protein L5 [Planctomycetota bacterium]
MAEKKSKDKAKAPAVQAGPKVPPRLQVRYRDEVVPALQQEFSYPNPMMIPRLGKIVVNMGIGKAVENKARIEAATKELGMITGQRPVVTKARKSIATFKLREGYPIGAAVTLRGAKMWEFLDRLVSLAIPRFRDFRGLPAKFDGRGNFTLGLSEQSVFPEIQLDKVEFVQGMNITFVTTAKTDQEGIALLRRLGMPFQR